MSLSSNVTDLATAVGEEIKAVRAASVTVVAHGATAGTARPSGFALVIWVGTVAPTNAVDPDLVVRTDEAV